MHFTAAFRYCFQEVQTYFCRAGTSLSSAREVASSAAWQKQKCDIYLCWLMQRNKPQLLKQGKHSSNGQVSDRGVSFLLSLACLPYRVPRKPQKPAMTPPLPCAAETHALLSGTSWTCKCPFYFPYFTRPTLTAQPALPFAVLLGFASRDSLLLIRGDNFLAVRRPLRGQDHWKWRKESSQCLRNGKGKGKVLVS